MPKVRFVNEQITVEVADGLSLREIAIEQGIEIYRGMWTHINCLGNGICGRCKVWVISDSGVSERSVRERFHRIQGQQRLACQVRVIGDVDLHTRPIGPAAVRETTADFSTETPSYRELAARRYLEAKDEAEKKARDEAEKKAKQADKAPAQSAPESGASPEQEAP